MYTVKTYIHNGKQVKTIMEGGNVPLFTKKGETYMIFNSFQQALEYCRRA